MALALITPSLSAPGPPQHALALLPVPLTPRGEAVPLSKRLPMYSARRLRHFTDVCVKYIYRGPMSRFGLAWYEDSRPPPEDLVFSRHVQFASSRSPREHREALEMSQREKATGRVLRLRNALFVDVSHGGMPNMWHNVCHWANILYPFYEAALLREVRNLSDVVMWQVDAASFERMPFQSGTLGAALAEAASERAVLHFDQGAVDATRGTGRAATHNATICFDRVTAVWAPRTRPLSPWTRPSGPRLHWLKHPLTSLHA